MQYLNEKMHDFTCASLKSHVADFGKIWSHQNVCDALSYLLDNIYVRFETKLYRQIVGILMGTNCVPLVGVLFFFILLRKRFHGFS